MRHGWQVAGDPAGKASDSAVLLPAVRPRVAEGDAEMVKRLKSGDPQALAEIYDRYGRVAYSLILHMVRDAAIAEDVVQETFLRVWSRARGFDAERGAFVAWLLCIARSRAIDYLRSASGRESKAVEWEEVEHPSLYIYTERDILASDKARVVRAALLKLAPQQREVIELAYFGGLTQTEMAERLGQPLGTVKTWMRTALKNLREELGAAAPGMTC
jgi:RNA polymerase sigma-70 factor, ECF subfamily